MAAAERSSLHGGRDEHLAVWAHQKADSKPLEPHNMRLDTVSAGKDNNLNLLRVLAATAVLLSHSFVLSTGDPGAEPLRTRLGMPLGSIAVDVFFIVSGFLVTGSIWKSQSTIDFVVARVLRIFPGLLVMLALTVFVMGTALTTLDWSAYLSAKETRVYLAKCATLFFGAAYNLPGVFSENPYKNAVNGSLWTLPFEVKMYAILAAMWLASKAALRFRARAFALGCVASAVASGGYVAITYLVRGETSSFFWLFFMFFGGAACFVVRRHIHISRTVALSLVVALVLAAAVSQKAFLAIYILSLPYITLYCAYGPAGWIRSYNAVGDFSYGIYIYAFPVQQALVAAMPSIAPIPLFLCSGIATLLLAMLSWFLIERKALSLKRRCVDGLMSWLGYRMQRQPATPRISAAVSLSAPSLPRKS
jgi:peptidoglycan/LPS O-acetylase OafA/YrhL